jgi:hypothetical protein
LCSMREFPFFMVKLLYRMGYFIFVAFFNHQLGATILFF